MSGAVSRLPFEARGFAPRMSRWSVRSMSGIGTLRAPPNMCPAATCFGIWSTVLAENTFGVPSDWMSARL